MDERVVKSSRSRCANLGQAAGASVNPVYTPRAIANRRALTRDRTLFGVDSAPLIRKPALGPACACARVGSRKSLCSTQFRNLASRIKMRHTHQRPLGTRPSAAVLPGLPFDASKPNMRHTGPDLLATLTGTGVYRFTASIPNMGHAPATPAHLSSFPIFLECSRLQMHPTCMVLPLRRTTIHPPRVGMSRNTTKKSKMSDYRAITLGLY
jgi:hypothetical protein